MIRKFLKPLHRSFNLATSPFSDNDTDEIISDINMTPLIDLMLVPLIIFLLALPIINQSIRLDLPQANSQSLHTQTPINLILDADGSLLWNEESINPNTLQTYLQSIAHTNLSSEIHLYAERAMSISPPFYLLSKLTPPKKSA